VVRGRGDVPDPVPADNQVLLVVDAAGGNRADALQQERQYRAGPQFTHGLPVQVCVTNAVNDAENVHVTSSTPYASKPRDSAAASTGLSGRRGMSVAWSAWKMSGLPDQTSCDTRWSAPSSCHHEPPSGSM
jgi:hypothetical protein